MTHPAPLSPIVLKESTNYLSATFKVWVRASLIGAFIALLPVFVIIAQSVQLAFPLDSLSIQLLLIFFIVPTAMFIAGITINLAQINRDFRFSLVQVSPIGLTISVLGSFALCFGLIQLTKSDVFDVLLVAPEFAVFGVMVALFLQVIVYALLARARAVIVKANKKALLAQQLLKDAELAREETRKLHDLATRMVLAWNAYLRDGGQVWLVDAVKKNGPQVTLNARRDGEGQQTNKNKNVWPNGFDIHPGCSVMLSSNNTVLYVWDPSDQEILEEAARTGWAWPEE